MANEPNELNVLVWHIHGSYLNLLVQAPHNFYLPVKPGRPEGYGGKGATFLWPDHVYEVPAESVRDLDVDLVVYQTPKNYFEDQFEILTHEQRRLPRIYLEHNTPKGHQNEMRHPVQDEDVLLVHVTHFNRMMWACGRCESLVIEHAALPWPDLNYSGELEKGIVAVNDIRRRGRITGYDVFERARAEVPLDLVGSGSTELGGLGDLPQRDLLRLESRYRFFFNPIRYTSLPLSVVEAMSIGMPVVALSTTELPEVIQNGHSGFVSNNLEYLVDRMLDLLRDPEEAARLGRNARTVARERFSIQRFIRDWDNAFRLATGKRQQ
jgi:hypothetical protein